MGALIFMAVVICALFAWGLVRCADDDDWRDEWCSLECWAEDGQCGPCEDCPARRRAK